MKRHIQYFQRLAIIAFFAGTATSSWAVNYYVNDNSTTGDVYTTVIGATANDGLTASTPKASLTEIWNTYGPSGTNVINSGDVIFVDAGTYLALDANLTLSVSGISITGAGSDLTIFDNNQTSADANRWATITGNSITITGIYLTGYNYGLGNANVIQISGVSNLTMNDVIANENLPGGGSGSIVVDGGSSVNFIGGGSSCNPGSASVAGGGVNIEGNGNDVDFTNYTFSANTKDYQGGSGLRVTGDATTTVQIDNCIFGNNENSSSEGGAAIFIANGASITIQGSCFNSNATNRTSSVNYGGAIMVGRGSTATINNCSFDGNTATSSGNGGAIAINTGLGSTGGAATVNIDSSAFTNNTATDGADILGRVSFSRPAIFNVNECTFSGSSEDVTNDNSATITLQNSGSPTTAGSVSFTNTTAASATPVTNCPTEPQPCFSVMPVTFDDFWSSCDGEDYIELQWSTLSELNNDYFIIERASEDLIFEEIARINGSGTTNAALTYAYSDRDAHESAYYRLSQVDLDGSRTYLKTIFATTCNSQNAVYAHQFHRASSLLEIFYHVDQIQEAEIAVVNASGFILKSEQAQLNPNYQAKKLDLDRKLEPGIYLVTVRTTSDFYQGKILVR